MAPYRYLTVAAPSTALIKSGKGSTIAIGRRMAAVPFLERIDKLSLNLRTLTIHTTQGTTVNGVNVDITACCQVKIQSWGAAPRGELHTDYTALRLAAQHFVGKTDEQVDHAIASTIAGHQRAIIGVLTVEELYRDRESFAKRVLELCYEDMRNMGVTIVSYTVAEISDRCGYIEALGVPQTELVKREAVEGKAFHQGKARSRKAKEDTEAHLEINTQQERVIDSDKHVSILKAETQKEIDTSVAIQQKAHEIADAQQDNVLFVKRQNARAAEAEMELEVVKQHILKERLVKEMNVHVEADANLYEATVDADSVRQIAQAEADKIRAAGQAEAEVEAAIIRVKGFERAEANARSVRMKGLAEADVVRMKGLAGVDVALAEADAMRARNMAEAEVLQERLKLWKELGNEGIVLESVIERLPEIAAAVAAPLAKTEKMVFIGSGRRGKKFKNEMVTANGKVSDSVKEAL